MTKVRVVCACPLRLAAGLCPGACISCPTFLFQGGRGTLEVAVLTCGQCPHNNYIFCKFYLCLHEETHAEPTQKFHHLYLRTKIKYQQDLCLLSETCWTAPHHPMFWLLSSNLIRSKNVNNNNKKKTLEEWGYSLHGTEAKKWFWYSVGLVLYRLQLTIINFV